MKKRSFGKALRAAFPCTIPVLTGYLFIGIAFGVMFEEKGYHFLWAALMSILVYAGSGQYLAVKFFVPGFSLFQIIFMELMINIRHIFYGLTFLEEFNKMGKKKWYMIFSLTDETYSLLYSTKTPEDVSEEQFLFAIALLNQCYWVIGSMIGGIAGSMIPWNTDGIQFAMTALFVVIFLEQWLSQKEHFPALAGVVSAIICLLIFGRDQFILPTMTVVTGILLYRREQIERRER